MTRWDESSIINKV